jgi:hypothetical protein
MVHTWMEGGRRMEGPYRKIVLHTERLHVE